MIRAVAFVPQAPALDPAVGRGLDDELGAVREACRAAVRVLGTSEVGVLGHGAAEAMSWLVPRTHPDPTALVVFGDGSARRSEKAPGYYDERAGAFDASVARALGSGDRDALAALDAGLGDELLAAGVPAWHEAAALLTGSWSAELTYDDAPFGVGYFVAVWTRA